MDNFIAVLAEDYQRMADNAMYEALHTRQKVEIYLVLTDDEREEEERWAHVCELDAVDWRAEAMRLRGGL